MHKGPAYTIKISAWSRDGLGPSMASPATGAATFKTAPDHRAIEARPCGIDQAESLPGDLPNSDAGGPAF